ncbi:MAG: hypothetical protein JHD02_11725, partial [Thermoleophilaceae bacterium]|nr:hypothetical protein [Thermoleophilaceae bacterium]
MISTLATVGFEVSVWSQIIVSFLIFFVVFNMIPMVLLVERKVLGRFQGRY